MQFCFGAFVLDRSTRQLMRGSREIHLAPKAYELLLALLVDRPTVLSKAALQERLWPDTFVAEANLSNLIAEVREALGDRARAPRFIRTAHGFGYAFSGEVTVVEAPVRRAAADQSCWLEWGKQRFLLAPGENVVGRDPDLPVSLDASTVSRRHARVVVSGDDAVLEDLGSKNGTFRGSDRVTSPVHLTDGDPISIGSLLVTFHRRGSAGSTETQGPT